MSLQQEAEKQSTHQPSAAPESISSVSGEPVVNNRSQQAVMRKLKAIANGNNASDETVQRSVGRGVEGGGSASSQSLPSNLKSGVEQLSGHSMDDVNVHYNSHQPAQLNANAYAQGSDIHLAPGQEQHLPHEAWHVAQQKQGRVAATRQLKSKVLINDDPVLEKEADEMGQRAMTLGLDPVQAKSESSSQATSSPIQLKAEIPTKMSEKEEGYDPSSGKGIEELSKIKEGAGLDKQLKFEGDLSLGVRFKSLFGDNSTYTLLLKEQEVYNKAKNLVDKQKSLKELKRLALQWNQRHEEEIKSALKEEKDPNLLKKYNSIKGFLEQTTSNFPQIVTQYDALEDLLMVFYSNPIEQKHKFKEAVALYGQIRAAMDKYKSTYPPSINLLYVSELADLKTREDDVTKVGNEKYPDLDTGEGFKIKSPAATFNLKDKTANISGGVSFTVPEVKNGKGRVSLSVNSEGELENIALKDAQAEFSRYTFDFNITDIIYVQGTGLVAGSSYCDKELFGSNIHLNVLGLKLTNEALSFDEVSGKLDQADIGLFDITETAIEFTNEVKRLEFSTTYALKSDRLPADLKESVKTNGKAKVVWEVDGDKYVNINEGELKLSLLSQELAAHKFSYDSKEKVIKAKTIDLTIGLLGTSKKLTGSDVHVTKQGLQEGVISMAADNSPVDLGPLTLTPSSYGLAKGEKGYGVRVAGTAGVALPDHLAVQGGGALDGWAQINFSEPAKPEFGLEGGKADLKMVNPLAKLDELFGDNWKGGRYSIGASVPVFPMVSAVFGLFVEYQAGFGTDPIAMSAEIVKDGDESVLKISVEALKPSANVKAGVEAGIQAGTAFIFALAVLLRAYGDIKVSAELGFLKNIPLGDKPSESSLKDEEGLQYKIEGELKLVLDLILRATALYFFQKEFGVTLAEKSLGSFSYGNTGEKKDPTPDPSKELMSEEDLKSNMDPEQRAEFDKEGLDLKGLLQADVEKRFSDEEVKKVIAEFDKSDKQLRADYTEETKGQAVQKKRFDDVHWKKLMAINEFIDQRASWDGIEQVFKEFNSLDAANMDEEHLKRVRKMIRVLGTSVNLKGEFVKRYAHRVKNFKSAYDQYKDIPDVLSYFNSLDKKVKMLEALNEFKGDHLHSKFWGDEAIQEANLDTDKRWFRDTKYEDFVKAYNNLVTKAKGVKKQVEGVKNDRAEVQKRMMEAYAQKLKT